MNVSLFSFLKIYNRREIMPDKYPINIWINDERYKRLLEEGLADKTEDVLAGMKVLKLYCTEEQKNKLLKLYPEAKYDSSTTMSIELLPPEVKNILFDMVIRKKNLVPFQVNICGYKRFSFMRASSVVNCQSTPRC